MRSPLLILLLILNLIPYAMKSFIKGLRHLPFENSMQVLPIDKSGVNKPRKVRQYLNQVVGYVYSEVIPE